MVQVTSPERGGCISASTSLSLSIGVCSDLVQTLWSWLSRRRVARVCTGDLTLIRVMHCIVKACLRAL